MNNKITLTEHQNNILDGVLEAFKTNRYVVLSGSAGTGKTTVMKEFINRLGNNGVRYTLNATTHEAARQLEEKTGKATSTIHSFHNLKPHYKRDGESTYLIRKGDTPNFNSINIVDEASMIGSDILKFIKEDMRGKYLFIGDEKQLPPVNDPKEDGRYISPIFKQGYPTFTLKEIWRQGLENDNIKLSMNLGFLKNKEDGDFYNWVHNSEVFNLISQGCTYISFRNKVVDTINEEYRRYKGITRPYMEGETIILQAPIGKLKNGERVKIYSIKQKTFKRFGVDIGCTEFNNQIRICTTKRGKLILKKRLSILAGIRDWKNFYALKNSFTEVKHSYAMTIHKSQGSTFDNVIVNISDAEYCRDNTLKEKLLYTALTRTSNKNYLV